MIRRMLTSCSIGSSTTEIVKGPWRPDDEQTRTLQYLVEHRRQLVTERTRISNRMTALRKAYVPQVLHWFDDIRTTLVCDCLRRWPT